MTRWAVPDADRPYLSEWWTAEYAHMTASMPDEVPDDFLVRLWGSGFFMDDPALVDKEWAHCMAWFGADDAMSLVAEPEAPRVVRRIGPVYPNAVHHLYHLARWEEATGCDLRDIGSVVEWGGGYGSLARICLRRNPALGYTIVDLPLLTAVTEVYLGLCGLRVDEDTETVRVRSLAPSSPIPDEPCDLFVSTWALDESSRLAQEKTAESGFYGAERLLLAFHPDKPIFLDSGCFADLIPADAVVVAAEPEGSFYAFR